MMMMPDDKFYQSKDWWKLRSHVRAKWAREGKGCGMCGGDLGDRPIADHILPRKDHPHLAFDPNNIQMLCMPCHNIKTHRHERLNLPKIGLDGMPEDGSWD